VSLRTLLIDLLARQSPEPADPTGQKHAAVALIMKEGQQGPEVLFIRRAEHADDPWSGDVAFPGGRIEPDDQNACHAAEREVEEEIGLSLRTSQRLGQLKDIHGTYLPVRVSCFVYWLEDTPELEHNYEVVDSFWVPLQVLQNPHRNRPMRFTYRGHERSHPVIDLSGYCEKFLWGITYRLLLQLLEFIPDQKGC